LSSVPFRKAGLRIFGVDGSREMLKHCQAKGVAEELKQHDIRSTPMPYPDNHFDHVLSCGVFHLIETLDQLFVDVARLLRVGGTFAFTFEELKPPENKDQTSGEGVLAIRNEQSGVTSYLHSSTMIEGLLQRNGFSITKTLEFVGFLKTEWADDRMFRAYVSRKEDVSQKRPVFCR